MFVYETNKDPTGKTRLALQRISGDLELLIHILRESDGFIYKKKKPEKIEHLIHRLIVAETQITHILSPLREFPCPEYSSIPKTNQRAHEHFLRPGMKFDVRDGVDICKYYLKKIWTLRKHKHGPSTWDTKNFFVKYLWRWWEPNLQRFVKTFLKTGYRCNKVYETVGCQNQEVQIVSRARVEM